MLTIRKAMRDKSGTMVTEMYPKIIIAAIVVATFFTLLPPLYHKTTAASIGNQVARYIEIQGDISVAQTEFDRLCSAKRVRLNNPSITVRGNTIGGSGRIQMDEEFEVIIEYDNIYEIGMIARIISRAAHHATGRSEYFWK